MVLRCFCDANAMRVPDVCDADAMLCLEGYFLACSSGIYFYISDIVQTNYLAYGMLQVHMIWQDAVMPTEYDNDGAINFLS